MKKSLLSAAEYKAHVTGDQNAPSLYVGTYGKYNGGSIAGAWVDLSTFSDGEEFFKFCKALHGDERDPEFMFQDYQNFPSSLYSECMGIKDLDKIISLFSEYSDDEREIIFEYWEENDANAEPQDILDSLVYTGDFDDYANDVADELIGDNDSILAQYFNYSAFARDLKFDYTVTSHYVFTAC